MIGPAVDAFFTATLVLLVVFLPLGLWKLVEIIIWIFSHVQIGVK